MTYKLDTIRQYTANGLAVLADCHNDNDAGSDFLTGVRDAVIELTAEIALDDWQRLAVDNYAGSVDEIADAAVSVYTFEKWQQFIGTRAWSEDVSDYMVGSTALDDLAALALLRIAERLTVALVSEIAESVRLDCV